MKIALFVGFVFFCLILAEGAAFRQCYFCSSSKSYEDCQESAWLQQCYDSYPCIQIYKAFDNGSLQGEYFYKGCILQRACEQVNKGNMTVICPMIGNHPFAECRGKCCYGEECNKGDILDLDATGHDSSKSSGKTPVTSGSVQRTSVLGLFYGLLLAVVSINY